MSVPAKVFLLIQKPRFPPPSNGLRVTSDKVLSATNGTRIPTHSPRELHLNLGLAREFIRTFKTADVAQPIIGADFLHYFGLLVDVRHKRLIDRVTKMSVKAISVVNTVEDVVKVVPYRKNGRIL